MMGCRFEMLGKMANEPPDAPEEIPTYIREGLDRQDRNSLEKIVEYCEARIGWLAAKPVTETTQLDAADDELVEVSQEQSGTVVIKKVTCGKSGCRCTRGHLHGPYKYVVTRRGDSLHWDYRGAVSSE